ncbi:MAG TPA: hypothetical protein VE782_02640 [Myxococcaceae bacterium]|nr:hypothetical protein [Myxococcaceae bacterium]
MRALALAALAASIPALAQDLAREPVRPLAIQQRVDPSQVKIGQPFTRTIAITHPLGHRYELLVPADSADLEILDHARHREDRADSAITTFTLRMAAFALGKLSLSPLAFEVSTPEGPRAFTSDPATVEVVATVAEGGRDAAELRDIRPPEAVPVPSYTMAWILLGAAAAAALTLLAWRWWRRPRPAQAISAPPRPLEVRTREALEALSRENLPSQGRIKEYYSRLSEIVRGYVGERYAVEALECTSSELLAALRQVAAPHLPRELLAEFLSESDLVKFARAQRMPDDCARALDFAYLLVARTSAPPPPPPSLRPIDAAPRELS